MLNSHSIANEVYNSKICINVSFSISKSTKFKKFNGSLLVVVLLARVARLSVKIINNNLISGHYDGRVRYLSNQMGGHAFVEAARALFFYDHVKSLKETCVFGAFFAQASACHFYKNDKIVILDIKIII